MLKIHVIGYGVHGKDTFADMLCKETGLTKCDSSRFACEKAVFPRLKHYYDAPEECYQDRRLNRDTWAQLISEYNKDDPGRLAREIFAEHDIYVGCRKIAQLEASEADVIIWLEDPRKESEPETSCEVTSENAHIVIWNEGTEKDLRNKARAIAKLLIKYREGNNE